MLFDLSSDPGERYPLNANENEALIKDMIKIKEEMSVEVIWNESEINKGTKRSAYPCCNSIECEPFPKCCDCTH